MDEKGAIKITVIVSICILLLILIDVLYRFNYIPHRQCNSEEFGITQYVSNHDMDEDIALHPNDYNIEKAR